MTVAKAEKLLWNASCCLGIFLLACVTHCHGNHDARRLYDNLLAGGTYNKLIRPAYNASELVIVKLGLKLSQLIDVGGDGILKLLSGYGMNNFNITDYGLTIDNAAGTFVRWTRSDLKNEILTLNMWVIQEWVDYKLQWDPSHYGNVHILYVPSEDIWRPDIVLYNNADGEFTVTIMTKATLTHNGTVRWEPPAIYRSHCKIDVDYFPFDQQICDLKFGAWTYGSTLVDLEHVWFRRYNTTVENITIDPAIDLNDYYPNSEWNIMEVTGKKNEIVYPCCPEEYLDITFKITIRRKTLFYVVNLIIPCVAINMLTYLAFYLPADCGEKISLCISILLSLSLFQLLLIDIMPPTSLKIPLLGKYILFTTTVVSLSVLCSVIVLAVHFRSGATHEMPSITRKLFLTVLPRLLFMQTPDQSASRRRRGGSGIDLTDAKCDLSNYGNPYKKKFRPIQIPSSDDSMQDEPTELKTTFIGFDPMHESMSNFCEACAQRNKRLPVNAEKAIDGVFFIAKHLKDDDRSNRIKDEWKYVAMVVDRLLLWVYTVGCIIGALVLLLNAPSLFDDKEPLQANYKTESGISAAFDKDSGSL